MMRIINIKAYAKINLALRIVGKRSDGYHNLESVFHCISLYDELRLSRRDDGEIVLKCNDPQLTVDSSNLVHKAAVALKELAQKKYPEQNKFGANIFLRKRIPVGAGLGGGSSDAASALRGLKKLWGLCRITAQDMEKLAGTLGSDVPFFLKGGTAFVTGRGENITPIDFQRKYHFLLVYPGFPVSTAWAYKNFKKIKNKLTNGNKFSKIQSNFYDGRKSVEEIAGLFFNDLEKVVLPKHPLIMQAKKDLLKTGALNSLMTGSGACVFGIFPSIHVARKGYRVIVKSWPNTFLVESVSSGSDR